MARRPLKIILDDDPMRETPNSFTRFWKGETLVEYMKEHPTDKIKYITFDNDLGLDRLEGYQVFDIMIAESWDVEHVNIHSQNLVAAPRMKKTWESAQRHGFVSQDVECTIMHLPAYVSWLKRQ